MKIPPIEYAMFCDYASVSMDGKFNLNGLFERILLKDTPARHPQMFVVTKLILPEGKYNITFTIMQEDEVLAKSNVEKESKGKLNAHTHFWGITNLEIKDLKPIELQILIDGKQVFVKRLPVIKIEQKKKA